MGKSLDWVREEATGRLIYRRAYPEKLRPFLANPGQRELKVPLAARRVMTEDAFRRYEAAKRLFTKNVEKARAALRVDQQKQAGQADRLTPELIEKLADAWKAEDLEIDADARWTSRPLERKRLAQRRLREFIEEDLNEALELRGLGALDAIVAAWGEAATAHAERYGFRIDSETPEYPAYVRAIHDAQVEAWQIVLRRLDGEDIPTPPSPSFEKTANSSQCFQDIVEGLLGSERKRISVTTKEATRTALRLFRELHGTPVPKKISRAMVADWLDMLAKRPAKLPKEHRAIPLPELAEIYDGQGEVRRLSPKTVAQHVSMLSARWPQAQRAGRIDQDLRNPFEGHDLERVMAPADPKGFSSDELQAIFSLPIWTAGERPKGGKGDASYWLPLLLIFTGARPEEIAQLRVDDILKDPESERWFLRITDAGEHPHKGRQSLKTSKRGSGRRTFPIPATLIDLGLIGYAGYLKQREEIALFPDLRVKGARNLLFAGFGDWWSGYLKANDVRLEGAGRQPARESRHTWSTAARRSGIRREAMAYIQGHALADATAGEGYGDLNPLGWEIDRLHFDGLDLSAVRPWKAH